MQGIDIKIARIKAGLKQYELAARLGIPQTMLSKIELGKRNVSLENLTRINEVIVALGKCNNRG